MYRMLLQDHRKTVLELWGEKHLEKARRYLADTLYSRILSDSSLSFSGKMEAIIEGLSIDSYSFFRRSFWKAIAFIILGQEFCNELIKNFKSHMVDV